MNGIRNKIGLIKNNHKVLLAFFFLVILGLIVDQTKDSIITNYNVDFLNDNNQLERLYPHRVNSIGKLKEVWALGFRSFEVDVHYDGGNDCLLRVGHDKNTMSACLDTFLQSVDDSKIQGIWVDFKNLNSQNIEKVISAFDLYHQEFNFKDRIFIESSLKKVDFKKLRQSGYHTSYYMPTKHILRLLEEDDGTKLTLAARKIARQTLEQNVNAISYDMRLQPFIDQYLVDKVSTDIIFHVWIGPKLSRYSFRKKIKALNQYYDDRIKTILIKVDSKHDI